jgi:hypothetical protein
MTDRTPLVRGTHHVAVICSDYGRSKRFYVGVLGLEVVAEVFRESRRHGEVVRRVPAEGCNAAEPHRRLADVPVCCPRITSNPIHFGIEFAPTAHAKDTASSILMGAVMRALCFLFLIAFACVVGLFAYQNDRLEVVTLFGETREVSFPVLVGCVYLLGMLSGWTVVGMVKRSLQRIAEYERQ